MSEPSEVAVSGLLRALLTSSDFIDTTAVGLVLHDLVGSVIECNPSAAALSGTTMDKFVGMDIEDQYRGVVDQDGAPYDPLERPVMISIREQRAVANEILGLDRVGSPRRWLAVNTNPVFVDGDLKGVISSFIDVTNDVERRRMLKLHAIVSGLVTSSVDEASLLQGLCDVMVSEGGYSLAWIGVPSPTEEGGVDIPFAAGATGYLYEGIVSSSDSDRRGLGPTGTAMRTRLTQVANNFVEQPLYEPWRERAQRFGLSSAAAIPLSVSTQAVLTVYDRNTVAFDDVLTSGLNDVAKAVEVGSTLLRSMSEIERSLEGTIRALARMTEARDPYTEGHQIRVGALGAAIAQHLGLDAKTVRLIRLSGEVHDVGKVAVPAEILTRPAVLAPLEMELVKLHSQVGADVLSSASLPWPIVEVAMQHHERLDGSGYPLGLAGDEIILPARIIAVADVIEAMTSHRPQRGAFRLDQALEEIDSGAGTRFDADVVAACIAVFESGFAFDSDVDTIFAEID
jgi:PAS domain S-box-containing protein